MLSRISVKVGKVGKGKAHANYIFACGAYTKKSNEVQAVGIANMLTLSHDKPVQQAIEFFDLADKHERKNGTAYREHILSLPREFSLEQQTKVVKSWIEKELKNLPTAWAIHHVIASDGKLQPHAHIMFSERINDGIERPAPQFFKRYNSKNPERGGAKKSNLSATYTERKDELKAQRERWGEHLRAYCYEFDFDDLAPKIDMRNWRSKGLQTPSKNIPMHQYQKDKRKPYIAFLEPSTTSQIIKIPFAIFHERRVWECSIALPFERNKQKNNELSCVVHYDLENNKLIAIDKTNDHVVDNFLSRTGKETTKNLIENEMTYLLERCNNSKDYLDHSVKHKGKFYALGEKIRELIDRIIEHFGRSKTQTRDQNKQNDFDMTR